MMHPDKRLELLWKESGEAARQLQRIADEQASRAEQFIKSGVNNPEREQELAKEHVKAIERVLQIGQQLEQAAIDAGVLPPKKI
ncbi:hypothetical protein ACNHKD_03800 [Methylocystis sp. JAN1]|uniref:hypothetical protein n=1 Tax=Methylocystis sp. JAN1 TaxID=3397211 RepID=UPI003FA1B6F1